MKVVVTGATGYIGQHIVKQLVSQGISVAAVVRQTSNALPDSVTQFVDSGDDAQLVQEFTSFGVNIVMHCAAAQMLQQSVETSAQLVEVNIGFGARMLAISHAAGVRGFISAGTYSTHADGSSAYAPQTLYAATKQAFTTLAAHYRRNTSMTVVVLELSDTYGPSDPRPKFLSLVREAATTGTQFEASPGLQVLHPIHVDDVARAFVHTAQLLIESKELEFVYSVHGETAVTLQELVGIYESVNSCNVEVVWGGRNYRDGEIMNPYTGVNLPEWAPNISLVEGLKQL